MNSIQLFPSCPIVILIIFYFFLSNSKMWLTFYCVMWVIYLFLLLKEDPTASCITHFVTQGCSGHQQGHVDIPDRKDIIMKMIIVRTSILEALDNLPLVDMRKFAIKLVWRSLSLEHPDICNYNWKSEMLVTSEKLTIWR